MLFAGSLRVIPQFPIAPCPTWSWAPLVFKARQHGNSSSQWKSLVPGVWSDPLLHSCDNLSHLWLVMLGFCFVSHLCLYDKLWKVSSATWQVIFWVSCTDAAVMLVHPWEKLSFGSPSSPHWCVATFSWFLFLWEISHFKDFFSRFHLIAFNFYSLLSIFKTVWVLY